MLTHVIRYLHGAYVPFRLFSQPSPESLPHTTHRLPETGLLVDTRIVQADGAPVIVCYPSGREPDYGVLGTLLGAMIADGTTADLPEEFHYAEGPIPPLGQLFGLPLVVDEGVATAGMIVFHAFSDGNFIELAYDDFARLEHPRVGAFASAGALAEATTERTPFVPNPSSHRE